MGLLEQRSLQRSLGTSCHLVLLTARLDSIMVVRVSGQVGWYVKGEMPHQGTWSSAFCLFVVMLSVVGFFVLDFMQVGMGACFLSGCSGVLQSMGSQRVRQD